MWFLSGNQLFIFDDTNAFISTKSVYCTYTETAGVVFIIRQNILHVITLNKYSRKTLRFEI